MTTKRVFIELVEVAVIGLVLNLLFFGIESVFNISIPSNIGPVVYGGSWLIILLVRGVWKIKKGKLVE